MQAKTSAGLTIDQFFINGMRQLMARYSNDNPAVLHYGGNPFCIKGKNADGSVSAW